MGGATVASGFIQLLGVREHLQAVTIQLLWGSKTQASGQNSTAIGEETIASGGWSTTMGLRTEAIGNISTAMGQDTKASGYAATAMGVGPNNSEWVFFSTALGGLTTA